ncbi:MAG: Nif3-like dinuclear metal center hexameric protein [Phycisphaerales bacterium]|nr:MAG: Nif3-like dinuclear metal center hexameric protein [Phycisphaerales bacterium]
MPGADWTVSDLIDAMERIAPPRYAETWDRVGLHLGRRSAALGGPVLLTIDLSEKVVEEAAERAASAIVAYHPPIWKPLTALTDAQPMQRALLRAAELGMAIYSPHTALDSVQGGVTDWLCEGLSAGSEGRIVGDVRALSPHMEKPGTRELKVVTFVPADALESVRNAMATGGAGIIGAYRVCSFATPGTGTFLGESGAQPAIGEAGRLEEADERRLEMVCARKALPLVVETLRRFHPYEEPAIDVYPLEGEPVRQSGIGRRLVLDQPATIAELGQRLETFLGKARIKYSADDLAKKVSRVGVCPGSGAELAEMAIREGCEVFVTGEMKHHEIIAAANEGLSIILAGHTNTERGYLPRLAARLQAELPKLHVLVSDRDADPLVPKPA